MSMQNAVKSYFRRLAEGYEDGPMSKVLMPVLDVASQAYGSSVQSIRKLYESRIFQQKKFKFPVISVGNLSWGGTGKTPLVEYLAKKIADQHKTPLILTRGYNQDEVVQFRHHIPKALIGVGKNRIQVAEKFARQHQVDVALLDDGLQHWPIARDLEIVAVNALNPFGNGKLIPRGILREPVTSLSRASVIVISHVNLISAKDLKGLRERLQEAAPKALMVESYLEPLFFYRAKNRERVMLNRLENQRVTTFSGIGAPRSFQLLLASLNIKPVRNFEFTDHHVFSDKDLQEIKRVSEAALASDIVTTEKDFYRTSEVITQLLNPLVLATRLRIKSSEEALSERIFRLMEKAVQ